MRREFDRKLVGLLDEGTATGEFQITDTRMTALAIGGMVSWAYVWYRSGGRLTQEQTSQELATLILTLAGATDATPRRGVAEMPNPVRMRGEREED